MSQFPLDKYVKVKELGIRRGGQGEVTLYELKPDFIGATADYLPVKVAIKTFPNGNLGQHELDIVKSFEHPNIVRCHGQFQVPNEDAGEADAGLVMEHCQTDLEHLLEVKKKFSPPEAVYLVKQIFEGLDYMHCKNIVHRNLELSNVLLIIDHENPVWKSIKVWEMKIKLGGFGNAKSLDSGPKMKLPKDIWSKDPGELEELLKSVNSSLGDYIRDDIKAVGILLYLLVTGTKISGPIDHKSLAQVVDDEAFLPFLKDILDGKSTKPSLKHSYVKDCMRDIKELKQDWQIVQMERHIEETNEKHDQEKEMLKKSLSEDMNKIRSELKKQNELKTKEINTLKEQLKQKSDQLKETEERITKIGMLLQLDEVQEKVNKDLFNASRDGDLEKMKHAIKMGADLEWKNKDYYNFTPLIVASYHGKTDAVRLLLKEGAQIDNTNGLNGTALWTACWYGKEAVTRILLENGADVEKAANIYGTPLMVAARNGHSPIVRLLLEAGAQIDKKYGGKTALDVAKENGKTEVVNILEKWANK